MLLSAIAARRETATAAANLSRPRARGSRDSLEEVGLAAMKAELLTAAEPS